MRGGLPPGEESSSEWETALDNQGLSFRVIQPERKT